MSFFKKILSDVVGNGAADALFGETSKNLAKSAGQHAAKSALDTAAEKAAEKAVSHAIDNATQTLGRRSALETPAAPPIPEMKKSLSVMVAVNGESYGPYERAGLLKMISDGSLTKETFVFIQGMSNWTEAGKVPEVAELFALHAPAPAVPPVPWAGASAKQDETGNESNVLSPKLNRLIAAAVADGEISDLERQVLIRNAQEEGVAMDEFVMILEARLYEQRRALQAQEDAKARAEKEIQIKATEAVRVQAPQRQMKLTKCPHCGAPIKLLASRCPECGYDYPAEESSSAFEKLNAALEAIDNESKSFASQIFGATKDITRKKRIIETFPIPSDKQGIFDFFIACAPLSKPESAASESLMRLHGQSISASWKKKAEQTLLKARVVLKDDAALLEEINLVAKQYKIKA